MLKIMLGAMAEVIMMTPITIEANATSTTLCPVVNCSLGLRDLVGVVPDGMDVVFEYCDSWERGYRAIVRMGRGQLDN